MADKLWDLCLDEARAFVEAEHGEDAHQVHGGYLHECAEILEESMKATLRDCREDLKLLMESPRKWAADVDHHEAIDRSAA